MALVCFKFWGLLDESFFEFWNPFGMLDPVFFFIILLLFFILLLRKLNWTLRSSSSFIYSSDLRLLTPKSLKFLIWLFSSTSPKDGSLRMKPMLQFWLSAYVSKTLCWITSFWFVSLLSARSESLLLAITNGFSSIVCNLILLLCLLASIYWEHSV